MLIGYACYSNQNRGYAKHTYMKKGDDYDYGDKNKIFIFSFFLYKI